MSRRNIFPKRARARCRVSSPILEEVPSFSQIQPDESTVVKVVEITITVPPSADDRPPAVDSTNEKCADSAEKNVVLRDRRKTLPLIRTAVIDTLQLRGLDELLKQWRSGQTLGESSATPAAGIEMTSKELRREELPVQSEVEPARDTGAVAEPAAASNEPRRSARLSMRQREDEAVVPTKKARKTIVMPPEQPEPPPSHQEKRTQEPKAVKIRKIRKAVVKEDRGCQCDLGDEPVRDLPFFRKRIAEKEPAPMVIEVSDYTSFVNGMIVNQGTQTPEKDRQRTAIAKSIRKDVRKDGGTRRTSTRKLDPQTIHVSDTDTPRSRRGRREVLGSLPVMTDPPNTAGCSKENGEELRPEASPVAMEEDQPPAVLQKGPPKNADSQKPSRAKATVDDSVVVVTRRRSSRRRKTPAPACKLNWEDIRAEVLKAKDELLRGKGKQRRSPPIIISEADSYLERAEWMHDERKRRRELISPLVAQKMSMIYEDLYEQFHKRNYPEYWESIKSEWDQCKKEQRKREKRKLDRLEFDEELIEMAEEDAKMKGCRYELNFRMMQKEIRDGGLITPIKRFIDLTSPPIKFNPSKKLPSRKTMDTKRTKRRKK